MFTDIMNALTVQNPRHNCDRETGMTTQNILDCNDYYTKIILIYICVCVTTYTPVLAKVHYS